MTALRQLRSQILGPRGAAKLVVTDQGRIVWANLHTRALLNVSQGPNPSIFDCSLGRAQATDLLTAVAASRRGTVSSWYTQLQTPDLPVVCIAARRLRLAGRSAVLLSVTDSNAQLPDLDPLTGCASRRVMDEALNTLESPGHMVVIDVNAMMAFNDAHGHTAGDAVLITIANRLRTGVGDRGRVFRVGVDFVVLLPSVDSARAGILLDELLTSLAEPITFTTSTLGGVESASVSASAGMAAAHPGEAHRNLRQADGALYLAKCQGVPYTIYKATDLDE